MAGEPLALENDASAQADAGGETDGRLSEPRDRSDDSDHESRLFEVLTAYLHAVESGQAPSRDSLLHDNPGLATELAAFLDEEDRLRRLVVPLRLAIDDDLGDNQGSSGFDGAVAGQSALHFSRGLDRAAGRTPRDFGQYELIEVIGSGGMGVVFRARQKGLDRKVALKMIRGGDLAADDDLRRFRLEAGAIAQLDHPHIVPIYEVGEHEGCCYYVMKLFGGGSLDRRLHEFADNALAAARLVAAVARAVHHAHQRGVLHRDLKPSNILIDEEGRGHVADFGLAKRIGAHGDATQTGLIVGTPSYMAPEQASGKKDAVTTATDVYGLGALLYTLLAGRPPFRGDSVLETIELVRLREPDPPTSIRGALDRDLQTICMTCLRKEPGRRYASAAALADDLDRWALGEPIAARPLKHAERVWLWARREPLSAGLAAALVVLSVAAIVGLVASNVMISHERDLARAQRKIAEEESRHAQAERQRAIERSQQARQAVDEMYTEVAEKWLYEQPKLSKVQRDFLEKALAFYEQFSREEGDDPAIQLERSKALSRLGWLQLRLGRPQEAAASLYKPVNILKSLVARYPDRPAYLEELGHVQATLASRFSEQKRWKEANQARESALAVYETLTRRFPAEPRYRIALATSEGQLGLQYQFTGRPLEAQKLAAGSMSSLESLQRDFPGRSDPHDLSTRMRILEDVGCVLIENRRFAEAERALREAIAIAENLPADTISHQDLLHRNAHTYLYLGYLLGRVGRAREAEAIYLRAQAILEQLAADFPDLPLYQVDVVDARLGLVDVDREMGRRSAAEQRARSQVTESERLAAAHPELVNCRRTLLAAWTRQGALLAAAGPPRELEAAYRRTVEVAEGLVATEPPGAYPRHRLGNSLITLGNYLAASGREKEAAALLERARETLETLCNDCPAVPEFLQSLGEALSALGELKLAAGGRAECEHAYERALTLFRQVALEAENDPGLADRCVRGLTSCPLPPFRDPARAIELAGRAAVNFPNNSMLASTLGLARYRVSDWKGAIAALMASKKVRDPGDVADWLILAMAHHRAGNKGQAKIWFERATSTAGDDIPRDRAWLSLREEAKAIMGIP